MADIKDRFGESADKPDKTADERRQNEGSRVVHHAKESIKEVRDMARNARRDAAINKDVIRRRAGRFAEGADKDKPKR